MKKLVTLVFISLFINSIAIAQDKITVVIKGEEIMIETYSRSFWNNSIHSEAYRLGPSAVTQLKQGIRTAIKWADLNENHKKSFEKEICRFKGMNKSEYELLGYVNSIAQEMILLFKGTSNGAFELVIQRNMSSYMPFIKFSNKEMVEKFKDLLDGKSVNKEIDDIFKN